MDLCQNSHGLSMNEKYTLRDEVTLAIQINGKVRGEIVVSRGSDEKYVLELAKIMKDCQIPRG